MPQVRESATSNGSDAPTSQIVKSFKNAVIDRFRMNVDGQECTYREYLTMPEGKRSGDEANAVDIRFTRYVLEWLGFSDNEWSYNEPQAGQKANRPDYVIRGAIGVAFIWEDNNSTLELSEAHVAQMRRYSLGTAGYAVWSNMRRIYAVHFSPSDALKYEIIADVAIDILFGLQMSFPEAKNTQMTNLALFHLLFGKGRFIQFEQLVNNIGVSEDVFEQNAVSFDDPNAVQSFIAGSRQSLNHLRLAALSHIKESLDHHERSMQEETSLQREWEEAREKFIHSAAFTSRGLDVQLDNAISQLTSRLGEVESQEISDVGKVFEQGIGRMSVSSRTQLEKWLERALAINSALKRMRFEASNPTRITDAYGIWSERQSDKEDLKPEIFAEQVAYVFFVRLLLVRVLEDKHILSPRLASDGGFLDWSNYVKRHFKELDGIGILNENYYNILSRKAGHYYLHFFQQNIFDWFHPDDFLLVETLEFLCRYNFQQVTSDIIGFTYEEYIERNARNRKGHFLTRQDVVEYMLDLLDYAGPQVIGRRILDPACGSGSFLVHAARRYRHALLTHFCNTHGLATAEAIEQRIDLRKQLAHRYLEDLSHLFYGTELNPFACYLAEMNLLIQGLDDLVVLQQSDDTQPIERFQIYNTDSLDLPREVLESADITGTMNTIFVPDRLSDRLTDDAYPLKAKLDDYAEGFFYIISNPPYVNSRQELMDVSRFKNAEFYRSVLSGDTNLYLLFLRLGLYYLADYGQMIYIVPLTIFGDRSASAARKLLKTPPFSPDIVTRFYRGDVLFPGVDQAVGIVRVRHSQPSATISVSGGDTLQDAKNTQFQTDAASVIEAVPQNGIWQGNWLVAQSQVSLDIWAHVKQKSGNFSARLGNLLDATFETRQGDVNATLINPLRIQNGSFAKGNIAIYKGEDVEPYAPLPAEPSDWVDATSASENVTIIRSRQILERLKQAKEGEQGIVLRQVARLNTREYLKASWFERTANTPTAFTNELWRMLVKPEISENNAKSLLAFLNSKVIIYLINLFSTNNHVSKDELDRVPIPSVQPMPIAQLSRLADELLSERVSLERDFVRTYNARLPDSDSDSDVYIPPSAVLASTRLPRITLMGLVGRGAVKNMGPATGRIRSLRTRNLIVSTLPSTDTNAISFDHVLMLFLSEQAREDDTWGQAQNWQLPDPVASGAWLQIYNATVQQAQAKWERFMTLQLEVDALVADWYGFNTEMRAAIAEGLPWARRRKNA